MRASRVYTAVSLLAWVAASSSLTGCSDDGPPETTPPYEPPADFVVNERIVYTDGLHNENTEMLVLDDRIILIFRGGESGQIGSDQAHINVYASTDGGETFSKQSEVSGGALEGMRDIRDPKLLEMNGKVFLYAIARLPGGHYRDMGGEAWTVRAESSDKGVTWTAPEKTLTDLDDNGDEHFWGLWRITKRVSSEGETLYALGYDDGDVRVAMFSSQDGVTWERRSLVMDSYADVPSEAELQFFGDDEDTAVALVRLDNQGILQDGQSAICTSHAPFDSWECGRRIEQRLDGPTWLSTEIDGARRNFVVARKHLPCTYKRTAIYELRGDLTDPSADIQVCEVEVLPSAGDTAYTALAHLQDSQYLVSWYSSVIPTQGDVAWLDGTYSPADIWLANIDFAEAPGLDVCNPPPAKTECQPPPLPQADASQAASGEFLFAVAPVIYPAELLPLRATATVSAGSMSLELQPLDGTTLEPVGEAFAATSVTMSPSGTFTATFPEVVPIPAESYPLLNDPFLTLRNLEVTGAWLSSGAFCGYLTGAAQVIGASNADALDLAGSTFGAPRIVGGELPAAVGSCADTP
ncbi:MAG: sialidase family protein [Polyangiaceae bacterium]